MSLDIILYITFFQVWLCAKQSEVDFNMFFYINSLHILSNCCNKKEVNHTWLFLGHTKCHRTNISIQWKNIKYALTLFQDWDIALYNSVNLGSYIQASLDTPVLSPYRQASLDTPVLSPYLQTSLIHQCCLSGCSKMAGDTGCKLVHWQHWQINTGKIHQVNISIIFSDIYITCNGVVVVLSCLPCKIRAWYEYMELPCWMYL